MLIGRQSALDALLERIEGGETVAVYGEAGIGKTALLREAAEASGRRVYSGGALAQLRWSPYLPLKRALRVRFPRGDATRIADFVTTVVSDGLLILDDLQVADAETLALLPALAAEATILTAFRTHERLSGAARAAAERAGCVLVELERLDSDAAHELVRVRNPSLGPAAVGEIVAAAGGSPLFLEELAVASTNGRLVRTLTSRLADCGPQARTAAAKLALRGLPCPIEVIGAGGRELVEEDLATELDGLIALRQRLVGEHVVETLNPDERRRLHAEIAAALSDPAERARHEAAAGLRERARTSATAAAERSRVPAERASHLELAAACSESDDRAAAWLLEAAQAMAAAGDQVAARALAARVSSGSATERARAALQCTRASLALEEVAPAVEAALAGLHDAPPGGREELELKLELLRAGGGSDEPERRVATARNLLSQVELLGDDEGRAELRPRALLTLGASQLAIADADGRANLESALGAAREAGAIEVECLAARTLATSLLLSGHPSRARRVTKELLSVTREQLLLGWELEFRFIESWLDLHDLGDCSLVAQDCRELLDTVAVPPVQRPRFEALLALALADQGSFDDAHEVLARSANDGAPLLDWTAAEIAWLSGDTDADARANRCLEANRRVEPIGALAALTAAWTAFESDAEGPDALGVALAYGGAADELAAITVLREEPRSAERKFRAAEPLWAGVQFRGEQRCRLGAATALHQLHDAGARDALLALEASLEDSGMRALLARVRAALRDLGERRGAGRSTDESGLTAREREIVRLVGKGKPTRQIAKKLNIGASTVDTHVKSAVAKLGARNRLEAAALLERRTAAVASTVAGATPRGRAGEPPILLVGDDTQLAEARAQLESEGWQLLDGFGLDAEEDWRIGQRRIVCVGSIETQPRREAAIAVAARGAGLVIVGPMPEDAGFWDDLERLGRVRRHDPTALTPRMVSVLQARERGETVAKLAREMHVSEASAARALRGACERLEVGTVAEAVLEARRRGLLD